MINNNDPRNAYTIPCKTTHTRPRCGILQPMHTITHYPLQNANAHVFLRPRGKRVGIDRPTGATEYHISNWHITKRYININITTMQSYIFVRTTIFTPYTPMKNIHSLVLNRAANYQVSLLEV